VIIIVTSFLEDSKRKQKKLLKLIVSSVLMKAKDALFTRKTTPSSLYLTGAADVPTIWLICRIVGVNMKYDSLEMEILGFTYQLKILGNIISLLLGVNGS
jgi:hypothetical protein